MIAGGLILLFIVYPSPMSLLYLSAKIFVICCSPIFLLYLFFGIFIFGKRAYKQHKGQNRLRYFSDVRSKSSTSKHWW